MAEFTILDWDRKKIGVIIAEDISDGHHTISELYQHRHSLFRALVNVYANMVMNPVKAWKSKIHSDGTMFPGWFIAGLSQLQADQSIKHLTYHIPIEWWDSFRCEELIAAPEWDGHTSDDVLQRLMEL